MELFWIIVGSILVALVIVPLILSGIYFGFKTGFFGKAISFFLEFIEEVGRVSIIIIYVPFKITYSVLKYISSLKIVNKLAEISLKLNNPIRK